MFNVYEKIKSTPDFHRQFRCGESLMTYFNCFATDKYLDAWSQHNYFVYVVEGRRIWHTGHGSYDLQKGDCVFVRKGGCIVEQFFDAQPCFIYFFMTDDFIRDTLQSKALPETESATQFNPVIPAEANEIVEGFFHSMITYFRSDRDPDQTLLQLKFRELILTLTDNEANHELRSFLSHLLQKPRALNLRQIMEDNFRFNIKLDEYAQLSNRSLSAFKRDFETQFKTSPGKWLLEKRLNHALHLLTHFNKSVGEAAFESGFENASHFSRAFRHRFGSSPANMKRAVLI